MKHITGIQDALKKAIQRFRPLRRPSYHRMYNTSLRQWLLYHQKEIVFDQVRWMGVPIWKNVLDAWIYQEIIFEIRPEVIIEIGSKYGGSTKYLANLLDLIGSGTVISIDKERSGYDLVHPRVIVLTGESADPQILEKAAALSTNRKTMAIHDADHRYPAVMADLKHYSPMVSIGSYFIVEDGIVDLYHYGDGLGFKEPGPLAAIEDFLKAHPNFEPDAAKERYRLTYNPKGYLKRIS